MRLARGTIGCSALVFPSGNLDGADAQGRPVLRQTEGLVGFGMLMLDLSVPDPSTPRRRAETLEVPRPQPRRDGELLHLLVDSTDLKLCGAGEWLAEKHGTKTHRSPRKLHIGLGSVGK